MANFLMPIYLTELGASVSQVGLIFTLTSVVILALQILGGASKVAGGAFSGLFQSSVGFVSLPAPWVGAQLWEQFSPRLPFMITAGVALVTVIPTWLKFKAPRTGEPAALPDL